MKNRGVSRGRERKKKQDSIGTVNKKKERKNSNCRRVCKASRSHSESPKLTMFRSTVESSVRNCDGSRVTVVGSGLEREAVGDLRLFQKVAELSQLDDDDKDDDDDDDDDDDEEVEEEEDDEEEEEDGWHKVVGCQLSSADDDVSVTGVLICICSRNTDNFHYRENKTHRK